MTGRAAALCLTLLCSSSFAAAKAEHRKMAPPCSTQIECAINPSGQAHCRIPAPAAGSCAVGETAVTWSRVSVTRDGQITRERVRTQRRGSGRTAQSAPPGNFQYLLTPGRDFEVQATLLSAAGEALWSTRLFLIWLPTGFEARINHPAIESTSTATRHVAFEKSEP